MDPDPTNDSDRPRSTSRVLGLLALAAIALVGILWPTFGIVRETTRPLPPPSEELETWARELFEALQAGDRARIGEFVADADHCVRALGPLNGRAMAENVSLAFGEDLESLLAAHDRIGEGVFIGFRHDEPEALQPGEEGLVQDAVAVWDCEIEYEVVGRRHSFPVFSVLRIDGAWRITQLRPPQ